MATALLIRAAKLALWILRTLFLSRHALALENLALRQQIATFKDKRPRPPLDGIDRAFWIGLREVWAGWLATRQPEFLACHVSAARPLVPSDARINNEEGHPWRDSAASLDASTEFRPRAPDVPSPSWAGRQPGARGSQRVPFASRIVPPSSRRWRAQPARHRADLLLVHLGGKAGLLALAGVEVR